MIHDEEDMQELPKLTRQAAWDIFLIFVALICGLIYFAAVHPPSPAEQAREAKQWDENRKHDLKPKD